MLGDEGAQGIKGVAGWVKEVIFHLWGVRSLQGRRMFLVGTWLPAHSCHPGMLASCPSSHPQPWRDLSQGFSTGAFWALALSWEEVEAMNPRASYKAKVGAPGFSLL